MYHIIIYSNTVHRTLYLNHAFVSILASAKTTALAEKSQEISSSTYHAKTEICEEIMEKEIVYEEIQSYTEVKASHTQMSMTVGQSLTLRANIPAASDIRWILNGVELANSDQYRYGVSGNDHTLAIKEVSQQEEGVITCEAKTEHGLVKCQFDTTVSVNISDAPSFLVQPRSQNINEGESVKFTCEIAGAPAPEVEWLKDNIIEIGRAHV